MANLRQCDSLNETEAAEFLQQGGNVHDAVQKALQSTINRVHIPCDEPNT